MILFKKRYSLTSLKKSECLYNLVSLAFNQNWLLFLFIQFRSENAVKLNKRDWRSTNKLWTGKLQGYKKGGVWGVNQHRSRHIMSVHVFQLLSSKQEMKLLIQHMSLYHMAWSVIGWLSSSDSILIFNFFKLNITIKIMKSRRKLQQYQGGGVY